MKTITVHDFKQVLASTKNDDSVAYINVCTPAEYKEKHIAGVKNIPLGEIGNHIEEFTGKETVYVHCRSGKRSEAAIELLQQRGVRVTFINVSGGILAWEDAGLSTTTLTNRMPIMRQVLLVAGLMVLSSVLLGWLVHESLYLLAGFVGLGLTFAGATGWCGMSYVLAWMPWNQ